MTLRARLSLIVTCALLVGLGLFGTLAYASFVRQQVVQLNELLLRDLTRVETLMQAGPEAIGLDFTSPEGDFVLQLVDGSGRVVGGGDPFPPSPQPQLVMRGERTLLSASAPWRLPVANRQGTFIEAGTLRLGLDVTADLAQRRALRQSLLVSGGVIAFAVAAVNLVLLGQALAPLARLAAQARRIDPASPGGIQHKGPHDEVAYVAQALNRSLRGIRKRQQAERASLAEIAHELAAPLTLVAGHLESLRLLHPDDKQLGAAQAAANELLYTSKDLLTLARGELERSLDLQVLDLGDVAERIAAEYPGVRFVSSGSAELAGSPERLAQLVRNLVRNAVQAAGAEKVTLAVKANEPEGEICLSVEDRGPGVPKNELAHLFERFYTKRKQGGTGVGLSVAQQIARQHGGDISVASTVGVGTCFTLSLPSLGAQLGDEDLSESAVA